METKNIEEIWKSNNQQFNDLSTPIIKKVSSMGIKTMRKTNLVIWFYLMLFEILLISTSVFSIWNLTVYKNNDLMLGVHLMILLGSVGAIIYGLILLIRFRKITRTDLPLIELLQLRIRFYRRQYHAWLWVASASVVVLSFSINSMTDVQQGTYPINHPWMFALIMIFMFGAVYGMLRAANYPLLYQLNTHLSDLQNQTDEKSRRVEVFWGKNRWWVILLIIAITLVMTFTLVLGIRKNLKAEQMKQKPGTTMLRLPGQPVLLTWPLENLFKQ